MLALVICASGGSALATGAEAAVVPTAVASVAASTLDGRISASEVIARADAWFTTTPTIVYSQTGPYYPGPGDGRTYRRDCSGYVSMAWHLSASLNTTTLRSDPRTTPVALADLQPGDALITSDAGGHAVLFEAWQPDHVHFSYYSFGTTPIGHGTATFSQATLTGHPTSTYGGWRYANVTPSSATDGDFYVVNTAGASSTEVHAMSKSSGFQTFTEHASSALGKVSSANFTFAYGDYNRDGITDVWAIQNGGTGSGKTEVHILDGATHFSTYLLHAATALGTVSKTKWAFAVGDFNGDGTPDLSAIDTSDAATGRTAWHVLDGRNLGTYLLHSALPLAATSTATWAFTSGDFNGDGRDDLYAVNTQDTGAGSTSYHVLNAVNPQQYLLHATTPVAPTSLTTWSFAAADYNGDGHDDLYLIDSRDAGTGRTAIHVLDATSPTRWRLHTGTALGQTALTTWQEGTS